VKQSLTGFPSLEKSVESYVNYLKNWTFFQIATGLVIAVGCGKCLLTKFPVLGVIIANLIDLGKKMCLCLDMKGGN